MAHSTRKAFVLACALVCGLGSQAHAATKIAPLPVEFTAQSFFIDYKNSFTTFKKVQISQGNMSITADQGRSRAPS